MRLWKTWCLAILLVAAGPVMAQKVYIDYDKSYDGSGVKTFAWAKTSETSVADKDPLLHSRIVKGIEYYLALSGRHEDVKDPDIHVTYHTSTSKEISIDVDSYGYGYPGGWGYYGRPFPYGGAASATVRTYDKGTLIVDIWDTGTDKLIWRGMAVDMYITANPEKMTKRIDKALKKIVDKWHKVQAKAAKAG